MSVVKKALESYLSKTPLPKSNQFENDIFEKQMKVHNLFNYTIPRFYRPIPREDEFLRSKLRKDAQASLLSNRISSLLDNEELKELWSHLDDEVGKSSEQSIDYLQFLNVKKKVSLKCQSFFTACTFAKLYEKNPKGKISVLSLFNYIMRKTWLHQTQIGLSFYDSLGNGFLSESELENYIGELLESLPQCNQLEPSFHSFYICTAVRKFFFFLDHNRKGQIRIRDILSSGYLDSLLDLRHADVSNQKTNDVNWFSPSSALRVYGQYLHLDSDHNGMLSLEEFKKFGTGTLTSTFLSRLFQEHLTYNGEMDYKSYLDFVLAWENKGAPESLAYFFRILDESQTGKLSGFSLHYFFRDICDEMRKLNQEQIHFEDVKDEIFDMVRPQNPSYITLKELVESGRGDTIISILTDLNGLWSYENRENLINGDNQEENNNDDDDN